MKILCVVGATATGKTRLALELAKELKTEIVSFDSVQAYKHFDIGTAKPTAHELNLVKHHLISEIEPENPFTAGDFKRRAEGILSHLSKSRSHTVLVGGTGFYLNALTSGMYDIPPAPPEIKAKLLSELKSGGLHTLYAELQERDPEYAVKIHPNDTYRILRGLEVLRSGPKTMTTIRSEYAKKSLTYEILKIGLQREKGVLKKSILDRAAEMVRQGLVEEAHDLAKRFPKARALESVGYKETLEHLKGDISLDDLPPAIAKSTILLAKRQTTWFKRDRQIRWFDPDIAGRDRLVEEVMKLDKNPEISNTSGS